tara:strand:+ start:129 stop:485 length:357 start_codon:yes stop_codon:yes gene_type:complete
MNKIVDKPWGFEEIIVKTDKYVMKKLFIKAGHRLSKQFHVQKDETIYVSKGLLLLDLSDSPGESNIIKLSEGRSWRIRPKTVHRFTAPNDQNVELFEVSTPELDDVVRLSDDYGRVDA